MMIPTFDGIVLKKRLKNSATNSNSSLVLFVVRGCYQIIWRSSKALVGVILSLLGGLWIWFGHSFTAKHQVPKR